MEWIEHNTRFELNLQYDVLFYLDGYHSSYPNGWQQEIRDYFETEDSTWFGHLILADSSVNNIQNHNINWDINVARLSENWILMNESDNPDNFTRYLNDWTNLITATDIDSVISWIKLVYFRKIMT